jgi:4-amino-4-deoxy-L-arabinose transferase-like glycosyltransferase
METMNGRRRRLFALALFAGLLFLELPGSWLLEPDEARYAEIPREMLAGGGAVAPRLNYVDYFEKPPLIYWANAAAIKALGHNPFAARLPSRLAALGVAVLLIVALRRRDSEATATRAALLALSVPLSFVLGRTNLTDGLLTLWLTLALLALHEFVLSREEGRSGRWAAALAGVACGLAVLTKGAVGVVLPGGALLVWAALSRRWRRIGEIVLSPAPVLFIAVAGPYFVLVERAAPGFSDFFWIHEHLLRYATTEAERPGAIYYFAGIFLAGFLPATFLLPRIVGRLKAGLSRRDAAAISDLWFASFASVILVFFSVSRSKLPPYILPMFPAAAVLAARSLETDEEVAGPLLAQAIFWTVALPAGLAVGFRTGDLARLGIETFAIATAAIVLGASWIVFARARGRRAGFVTALLPWSILYAALIAVFPRIAAERSAHDLAKAAGAAADPAGARVVCYRTYLQGFPWDLERRVAIYGWKGELAFGSSRGDQAAWFPPREQFLSDWDSKTRIVALLRTIDRKDLEGHRGSLVAENRKYLVVKNF